MSFKAIADVTTAEAAAKTIVANAEAKARQMLVDAENAGKAAVEAAYVKAESELSELRSRAKEKAVGDAEGLSKELESKKNSLKAYAESRLEKAADLVVERIVKS